MLALKYILIHKLNVSIGMKNVQPSKRTTLWIHVKRHILLIPAVCEKTSFSTFFSACSIISLLNFSRSGGFILTPYCGLDLHFWWLILNNSLHFYHHLSIFFCDVPINIYIFLNSLNSSFMSPSSPQNTLHLELHLE